MTHQPLVFLDTETTGLGPDRQAWEIAMIRENPDDPGTFTSMQIFVDVDLSDADPYALNVGGFYKRHPFGQQLASGGIEDLVALRPELVETGAIDSAEDTAHYVAAWTHGATIVGVNPAFDTETLAKLLRDHGLTPAWDYHLIDVLPLVAGHLKMPPPWKSEQLGEAAGVEPATADERHTALGDAWWAKRMYDSVLGGVTA